MQSLPIPLPTYSFLDVFGSISGPGLFANFGNGTGQSDEGITIEVTEDANRINTGADGGVMHALIGVNAGRIGIHVLKTSPLNAILNQAFVRQRSSSLLWGQNSIAITNSVTGDHITATQVAFTRQPANSYGKDPAIITWDMQAGHIFTFLGG